MGIANNISALHLGVLENLGCKQLKYWDGFHPTQKRSISSIDKFDSDRICFIAFVGKPWKPFNLFNLSSGIAILKLPSLNNAEEIHHNINNISNSGNTDYNTNTDLEGGINQQKYKNILDKDTLTTLNLSGKSVAGKNIEIKNTNYKDFSLNYNFNQRGDSITNNYNPNEDTSEEN